MRIYKYNILLNFYYFRESVLEWMDCLWSLGSSLSHEKSFKTKPKMKLNITRPLIVFDLETTGLDLVRDRIIQISYIKVMPDGNDIG